MIRVLPLLALLWLTPAAAAPDAGAPPPAAAGSLDERLARLEAELEALSAQPEEEDAAARRELVGRQIALVEELLAAQAAGAPPPDADPIDPAELDARVAAIEARAPPAAPATVTAADLEAVEADAAARRQTFEELDQRRRAADARLESLPGKIVELRRRERAAADLVRSLSDQISALPPGTSRRDLEDRLETARLDARAAAASTARLEEEQTRLRAGDTLLDRRLDLARRELRWYETQLELYRQAYETALRAEQRGAGQAIRQARAALQAATTPLDRYLARARLWIVESQAMLGEAEGLHIALDRIHAQQQKILDAEQAELSGLRTLVERDDGGERAAEKLQETFQRLDPRTIEIDKAERMEELSALGRLRSRRLEVASELFDIDDGWQNELDALPPGEAKDTARLRREEARAALRAEQEAIADAIAAGEALRATLADRERLLTELDTLVRSRIFWVQDEPALGAATLAALTAELERLTDFVIDPATWRLDPRDGAWPATSLAVLALLATIVLVGVHLRLRRMVQAWRRERVEGEGPRLKFAMVGLLSAALLPLWVWVIGRLVQLSALSPALRLPATEGCTLLAALLALWMLQRLVFRAGGLAEVELGLPTDTSAALRLAVRVEVIAAAICLVPMTLAVGEPLRLGMIGRLLYTAFELVTAVVLLRLLRPTSPVTRDALGYLDRPQVVKLARPVWVLLVAFALLVVGMDIAGYRYGAEWLAGNALLSLAALGVLFLGYIPLRNRVAPRLGAILSGGDDAEDEQRRRGRKLVWAGGLLITLVVLAVIWDVDRRALAFLDGISLYTMGSGAEAVAVTLADVVRVILVGVIIGLVLKWLPGLFDFVFFRYIDVEPGVRYAIVTIARYAFFFIGVLVAFDAVHLDLTKLGWLVAAVGVGLGFGLQEIVANFVSGIILLLERPIRIGDWITIGSIEGAVQTINIRATSILTLDRQEIIVPNKDLITTNVINWTRGDRVVRLKVPIGVAYGSDVDRVRKILLDVAKNDSRVLPAPPPTALLLAHGDSSLDFELRVHYENPAQRFPLLGALNAAINRALAEAGVEIPFPQRDIHIRSGLPDFEALLRPRPETSPRPETRDDDDAGDTRRQPDE
ncbi:MAG: mechanosensitive ion channel [Myxococcales bacterium]|nr:mechanosensitive ion channel [Myxococcales bacterium]